MHRNTLNKVYGGQTPLIMAINALGKELIQQEQEYRAHKEGEYKNIVGPAVFTLATATACGYVYHSEPNKEELLFFNNISEILENPIAIPGTMFFGGLIWLLPDLYHNIKTWYYRVIAYKTLETHAIASRYRIALRLLEHPDSDLYLATKEGTIALDTVRAWQEKVTTPICKEILFTLERKILEKMDQHSTINEQ